MLRNPTEIFRSSCYLTFSSIQLCWPFCSWRNLPLSLASVWKFLLVFFSVFPVALWMCLFVGSSLSTQPLNAVRHQLRRLTCGPSATGPPSMLFLLAGMFSSPPDLTFKDYPIFLHRTRCPLIGVLTAVYLSPLNLSPFILFQFFNN